MLLDLLGWHAHVFGLRRRKKGFCQYRQDGNLDAENQKDFQPERQAGQAM